MFDRSWRQLSLLLVLMVILQDVVAQRSSVGLSRHGVAFTVGAIDHYYTGSVDIEQLLEYNGIGYGLSYIGPQLRAAGLYAQREGGGEFLDISGLGWLMPSSLKKDTQKTTIGIPIGFLIAWRRVTGSDDIVPFNAQAIHLGAGGALIHHLNQHTRLDLKMIPLLGVTGTRDADSVGLSWAADVDVFLTVLDVFSDVGLMIGYTFRYQTWNINGSRVFSEVVDEAYDYAGTVQTVTAGVRF
ncbi:MAG: hypothetical protein OXF84_05290 [Bacteroidetes bacterium]|nr:hypothetical protein [Bacteroidota bacterium]